MSNGTSNCWEPLGVALRMVVARSCALSRPNVFAHQLESDNPDNADKSPEKLWPMPKD